MSIPVYRPSEYPSFSYTASQPFSLWKNSALVVVLASSVSGLMAECTDRWVVSIPHQPLMSHTLQPTYNTRNAYYTAT